MTAFNLLLLLVCFGFVIGFFLLARSIDRANIKANQPIAYVAYSTQNTAPWRWRHPDDKLRRQEPMNPHSKLSVVDEMQSSSLNVPQRSDLADGIAHLMGYCMLGSAGWMGIRLMFQGIVNALFFFMLFFGTGWLFLQTGNRVVQIDLYRDRITVIVRHPLLKRRCYTYARHPQLSVTGRVQSMLSMNRGQTQPDYLITIVQPYGQILGNHKTFHLACGIAQGGWIVAGLEHWRDSDKSGV